ncbi:MAG TPA: hypothetical protein VGO58_19975 [Chitinophagaceae bacterium]|jgi:hypothetical protein|nr:hypothetical protein [Chitinophagaceae bacterium]
MRTTVLFVRLPVLICLFAFFSPQTKAQSISTSNGKIELGLGLGPMFFVGDLGGSKGVGKTFVKDLDLPLTKFSKGIYLNYYPAEFIGLRVAANLGYLEGDDKEAPDKGGAEMDRRERNLNFRSKIREVYAALEIYPTYFIERYDGLQGKLRPYVLAGVGMFKFDPETRDDDGRWVKTAPLRLEGQGFAEYPDSKPYNLTQKHVLGGIGFKYYFKENLYLGLEILHRKLFTDHVDDVSADHYIDPIYFDHYLSPAQAVQARRLYYRGTYSFPATRPYEEFAQRGDPKQNDAFFSSILRFGWRIGGGDARNKQLKCPVFF